MVAREVNVFGITREYAAARTQTIRKLTIINPRRLATTTKKFMILDFLFSIVVKFPPNLTYSHNDICYRYPDDDLGIRNR